MLGLLLPNAEQQFFDDNGAPLAGGFVYTYVPGTTTPKTTWVDPGLTVANTNPIQLDSGGRAIIWGSGQYRQVVTDLNGNVIWDQPTGELDFGLQLDVLTSSQSYILKAAKAVFLAVGAGGGGSGTNTGTEEPGSGGSGGMVWSSFSGLTIGNTLSIGIGAGGIGGGSGNVGGAAGTPTVISSGTQIIPTASAGGGGGSPGPGLSGVGGTSSGGSLAMSGMNAQFTVPFPVLGPYGTGGSAGLNGVVLNGTAIVNQNGAPGLVLVFGIW